MRRRNDSKQPRRSAFRAFVVTIITLRHTTPRPRRNATTMFTASIFARGKAAIAGSETEQRISVLLYDDAVQEISSFELNQLASLTYHEAQVIASATDMAGLLIDHLEKILSQPAQFSTVSMQKSLAVTEHLLLFGAEKVIRMIQQQLGRHVDGLRTYNTVLLAQQQQYGSWWMQLKGGGVDQGGPVRDKAQGVVQYLLQPHLLHHERQRQADPNSLVPIGSLQQVAFCTDEMRFQKLKEQIERQHAMQIRSNLAKASDGFGSGYNAANGQMVVGAAHGLEEMMAQQRKQEQKFRDDRQAAATAAASHAGSAGGFAEYRAPNLLDDRMSGTTTTNLNSNNSSLYMGTGGLPAAPPPPEVDLLDMSSWTTPAPVVPAYEVPVQQDLLAFAMPEGAVISSQAPLPSTQGQIIDPFAPSSTTLLSADQDLLGQHASTNTTTPTTTIMQQGSATISQPSAGSQIMLSTTTLSHAAALPSTTNNNDPFAGMAMSVSPQRPMVLANSAPPSSSADKFAALDGLAMSSKAAAALPIGGRSAGTPMGHSAMGADWNNVLSAAAAATTSVVPPATTFPPISLSSIRIGQTVPQHTTTNMHSSDDNDNSDMYMMGGITGAGLAPPPMASPPPPPGGGFF
jgi:hypothetical protein